MANANVVEIVYGVAATIVRPPLRDSDGLFVAPSTLASGDVKISNDAADGMENIDSLPTAYSGGKHLAVAISAAEATKALRTVEIIDQPAGTAFLDTGFVIETINHPSAAHPNGVLDAGVPQAYTASSITLASTAPANTSLCGCVVYITHSDVAADVNTSAKISDTGYNGASSFEATLSSAWSRTPTGTASAMRYAVVADYKTAALVQAASAAALAAYGVAEESTSTAIAADIADGVTALASSRSSVTA
jgi:hypothetical protein